MKNYSICYNTLLKIFTLLLNYVKIEIEHSVKRTEKNFIKTSDNITTLWVFLCLYCVLKYVLNLNTTKNDPNKSFNFSKPF